jgi:uncharacterized protein (DUF169 family)
MGNEHNYYWKDLQEKEFTPENYYKLMTFDTFAEGRRFVINHPEIENRFKAYVMETDLDLWNNNL